MKSVRTILTAGGLALLAVGSSQAGVTGKTYQAEFRLGSLGACSEAMMTFNNEGDISIRECQKLDGTFSEIDLFFVGVWSWQAETDNIIQGLTGQAVASGIQLYGGARIFGSGDYQGFPLDLVGVAIQTKTPRPTPTPGLGSGAGFDPFTADLHRSPARL